MILDQAFTPMTEGLPFDETRYQAIPAVGMEDQGRNFLLDPDEHLLPGWHIDLDADERVITKTFSLSGVTTFTSYIPENLVADDASTPVCSKTGQSRVFIIYTDSANAILTLEGQQDPVLAGAASSSPIPMPSRAPARILCRRAAASNSDQLTDDLEKVMETLRGLFPDNCRFANFTLNIKSVRSDTGAVFIAPVPICIIEKNWKEF